MTLEITKLTDWKSEPSLKDLKEDYESARSSHDSQVTKINNWNKLLKAEPNKTVGKKARSSVQPKIIRKQAEWRYSALTEPFLSSDRLFTISPRTFEDVSAAKQNEVLLNWQFDTKLDKVSFIDNLVRATVDEGTSIVRVGWRRKIKKTMQDVPVFAYYPIEDEESMQLLQQAVEASSDPSQVATFPPELKASVDFFKETQQPAIAQVVGKQKEEVEEVVINEPTVEVFDPANVIIDPSCNGDLNNALFVIVRFESNRATLMKEAGKYKNLDSVQWDLAGSRSDADFVSKTPSEFNFKDNARKKVIVYEYWGYYDIHGTGELVPIIATWIGNTLIRLEESPFPDGKVPFVLVKYSPNKRELYGEPDAELLEDNQAIIGAVTRGMLDSMGRSANSQIGFAKGLLDPLNKRKFELGDDYEYNPIGSPAGAIIEHKYPEIPGSAMNMLMLQNQEAESITGVKSFSGGLSGEAYGKVAAGIRGMLDAASKREMAILRRLSEGVAEIGKKILAMNGVFLSDTEVIRVTNKEFVEIRRDDLTGQFDLMVDISTAEVDNNKANDLGFMVQTIGNTIDPSFTQKLLAEIADLKRMPELAEDIRTFQPQPSEMEQQMAQLEMQKKQAELEKLMADAEYSKARAEYARLMAQKIGLDTEEQGSGIKHERDLEKQRAQSEGNQNLAITKALVGKRGYDDLAPDVEAAVGFNTMSKEKSSEQIPTSLSKADILDAPDMQIPDIGYGQSPYLP